jgi:hypothetical protein
MSNPASLAQETAVLDAIDAALEAPDDDAVGQRLSQASVMLPYGYRYSAAGGKRLRAQAARRGEQNRAVHQLLIEALKWQDDAEAIAFMLDMLPDEGFCWRAAVALDYLDPVLVARPLRDWLVGRDPEALPDPLYVRALRAKTDLASPPEGAAVPVTEELLEHWIKARSFVALRLAFAHGTSAKATLGEGETLLHHAVAAWTNEDPDILGEPSRADWEALIGDLFAAGAEADRKLTARFAGQSRHRWPKGTTPRDMLDKERERGEVPAAVIDRLEARFPANAAAAQARAKKVAKKAAKKAAEAALPKPRRDISFRRPMDEALAGLRGTALGPALDEALAGWTDETLEQGPYGPLGYATSILAEIGKAVPEVAAKVPGWMGLLMSPDASRFTRVIVAGSREEARLLNDMSMASLERSMERVTLDGWPAEAAAMARKEAHVAYRGDAFLIGKKKGDTTLLWEASREGVVDLGTAATFLTALVAEARRALLG